MKVSPATKVGILTIVALVVFIFGIMWLKGATLESGDRYTIEFSDVDGMRPGAMVQLMGLKIGQVEQVSPLVSDNGSKVQVRFLITNTTVTIPQGSVISVQQSGIIGEKFLEITPPAKLIVKIPVDDKKEKIDKGTPVNLFYKDKTYHIGEVYSSRMISSIVDEYINTNKGVEIRERLKYFHEITYFITRAGFEMPQGASFKLGENAKSLVVDVAPEYIVYIPSDKVKFTAQDPLRLKRFLELQVESAEALKVTNDKINQLLQPEQIQNVKETLKNTKVLTARAADVIGQANDIMASSKGDLKRIVDSSSKLTDNLVLVSNNINDIIGDPKLRQDVKETVTSIKKSTTELSVILSDPNIKETIAMTKETSKNVSELVAYIKGETGNEGLKKRLDYTMNNLNESLNRLTTLLERVDKMTATHEDDIKKVISESTEISDNMKKFSNKLNKHFLLFRLLF